MVIDAVGLTEAAAAGAMVAVSLMPAAVAGAMVQVPGATVAVAVALLIGKTTSHPSLDKAPTS